ncbi:MAG: type II toxin-antitoxin system VapC family toxin [Candidatus Promineofilum sp.]|nr:type II toxin-antitoxin system VapC family toxin [Promineifilum sp.]
MNLPNRFLLDTDILIDYIRARAQAVKFVDNLEGELLVSAVTVAELYAGARDDTEQQRLDDLFSAFSFIPVDKTIAKQGGRYRYQYGKSHGTGLMDALIAATAETEGATFVTFNRRHFPMIVDLQVPYER